MDIDYMISVLQAYKDGQTVQWRTKGNTVWEDYVANIVFDFSIMEYRVKPEPREFWLKLQEDGSVKRIQQSNKSNDDFFLMDILKFGRLSMNKYSLIAIGLIIAVSPVGDAWLSIFVSFIGICIAAIPVLIDDFKRKT